MTPYYLIIPSVFALFCCLMGVISFRQLPATLRLVIIESLMSISSDFSCYLASKFEDPIHNVFLICDTILLLLTSISVLPSWAKIRVPAAAFSLFLISYITFIIKDGFYHFANYALVTSSLLLVVTYMIAAYNNELNIKPKASRAVRIFCIALILYHCGTFIVFLGFDFFMSSTIYNYIVDINTTLDSVKYLLIAIAFYLFKKKAAQVKPENE